MSFTDISGLLVHGLWTSLSAVLLLSCEKAGEAQLITIEIPCPQAMDTRSFDPDEERISDINLFVFSEDGMVEESRYLSSREIERNGGMIHVSMPLVRGIPASIACCANFGYRMEGIQTIDNLAGYRYHMAYPDEYSKGMPMSCIVTGTWDTDEKRIVLPLRRMMARISVAMDRSALDSGVSIKVRSIRIASCPRSASVIGPSHAMGSTDVFTAGFVKSYSDADAMNIEVEPGISGEVSVYMLENMMGDLLDDTTDDYGKVPGEGLSPSCSFIEIACEYSSPQTGTRPGEYLRYRFFPGESNWNFDIERNCHYHFTVQPFGDGLGDSGWRIDRSALE